MCQTSARTMIDVILFVATAALIAYKVFTYVTGKTPNLPPEIPRIPFWGSYGFLLWGDYNFPYKTITHYVKKYKSKIIGVYLGSAYAVVVNDYEGIKEVLTRREFDGRQHYLFFLRARAFGQRLGIFFNDSDEWLVQRRFTLRNLRDFGFGRRHEKVEGVVAHEVSILVDMLKNGPADEVEKTIVRDSSALFPDVLYASCASPMWFVMTGEMYDRKNYESLRKLSRIAMMFQRNSETTGGMVVFYPWLRHFGEGFGFHTVMRANYRVVDFFEKYLNKRKECPLMNDDDPEGFIHVYLKKLKECEGTDGFTYKQFLIICVDVIFPAISAVPSMLTHFIKLVMHYPEVLKKVQREIDDVVGRDRLPEWNDRQNLPYTEATMREGFRKETLTPWSVLHRATESTTLMGYDIPYNTVVATNLYHMHNDPDLWGDPENFRPERFLTADGKCLTKDFTLPFGLGRRVCIGETFARFVLFNHFAALVQNFNFEFVEEQPTRLEDANPGLIITPKEAWIRVVPRP